VVWVSPEPQVAKVVAFPDLKPSARRQLLGNELGSQFDLYERMFAFWSDGSVFDYGTWQARDLEEMLKKDGQAAAVEAVITLPIRQASFAIEPSKGDSGEAEFVNSVLTAPETSGGMKTPLHEVIGQTTSAQIYKRAHFEKVFSIRPEDSRIVYDKLAFRPPATCELKRNAQTGALEGFRQQRWNFGTPLSVTKQHGSMPGWVDIPKIRTFIHINGRHRQPLSGTSELEVCYWCHCTKLKAVFLWLNFVEQQSLPKVIVYGQDQREANAKADDIASMRSSGVAGFQRPPDGAKTFEVLESSGKGAGAFQDLLTFLETWQTASVLAGFTGLSSLASLGRGSLALSQDQSAFFLKSRQAIAQEMAQSFTHQVVAPLVVLNYGQGASFPTFRFGALTDESGAQLVSLFQAMSVAPSLQVPTGILDLITERMATVLDLDTDAVAAIVQQGAKDREAQAVAQAPPGMPPKSAAQLGNLAGGVNAAAKIAQAALAKGSRQPPAEDIAQPYSVPNMGAGTQAG
jgi:hypothetical protein